MPPCLNYVRESLDVVYLLVFLYKGFDCFYLIVCRFKRKCLLDKRCYNLIFLFAKSFTSDNSDKSYPLGDSN